MGLPHLASTGEVIPAALSALIVAADAMHDELAGQCEDLDAGSEEADTLSRLMELAQAYEAARPRD